MSNKLIHSFTFNNNISSVIITHELPEIKQICSGYDYSQCLIICDANTHEIARSIVQDNKVNLCVLPNGEQAKHWQSVEQIISAAVQAGIGRDGLFIGIGGGVVTDLAAFAAAIYMRGVSVRLVSTTILGMVDASVGGKTGFDYQGIKNLVGAFHPAEEIYLPLSVLNTLPGQEWKSGFAEIVKTAILADPHMLSILEDHIVYFNDSEKLAQTLSESWFLDLIHRCVTAKGKIVESDPEEKGIERALLNLGHTFGHALESVAGLGKLSHGEAVAWGIGRACELGRRLGITPVDRYEQIMKLLETYGYCTAPVYPISNFNAEALVKAMYSDKKKKDGQIRLIIPTERSAIIHTIVTNEARLVLQTIS